MKLDLCNNPNTQTLIKTAKLTNCTFVFNGGVKVFIDSFLVVIPFSNKITATWLGNSFQLELLAGVFLKLTPDDFHFLVSLSPSTFTTFE